MITEDELREASAGDAVCMPSNKKYGMKSFRKGILEYLAGSGLPCVHEKYEIAL